VVGDLGPKAPAVNRLTRPAAFDDSYVGVVGGNLDGAFFIGFTTMHQLYVVRVRLAIPETQI
jgi:hypothetical protein